MTRLSAKPVRPAKRGPPDRSQIALVNPVSDDLCPKERMREVRRSLARLEELGTTMDKITNRLDTIVDRLTDPALTEKYPPDHPKRLDAEALVDDLGSDLTDTRAAIATHTAIVETHGKYLTPEDLATIGAQLDQGGTAFVTVGGLWPDLLAWGPWSVLRNAACPF